ncbi:hypothetical protein B0H14DRAFT_3152660 [Mycena olivaceomarginata]|nr:hypothetical protein B0H14DRAFT_3152660 [Mycena olivaceomarginata]
MKRNNQYKPLHMILISLVLENAQNRHKQIVELLNTKHIDTSRLTRFRELRESMGLFRARKQAHTPETIQPAMIRLRAQYPKAGQHEVCSLLFHEENMNVPNALRYSGQFRSVITAYFAQYEPDLLRQRRANRLKRKHFCNPRLILSYYLDTVEESGHMPLVSQSDPGVENFGVANGHTLLRHWHDPSLEGTLQHRWMNEKKNVIPEIGWSQLRRRWTPGFEDILDIGVNNGWYNPSLIFRWVFIPWLQKELDLYRDRVNNTAKRADRNKVLPHGVPNHMYEAPEDYGALDFKICVNPIAIAEVRNLYAPPDHDVFELVPRDFAIIVGQIYQQLGQLSVTRTNCWDIYMDILTRFQHLDSLHGVPAEKDEQWGYALTMARDGYKDDIELIPNLRPLYNGADVIGPDGTYYMGGVRNGLGLDAMIERDEPLPVGLVDLEEADPLITWFSEDEGGQDSDHDECYEIHGQADGQVTLGLGKKSVGGAGWPGPEDSITFGKVFCVL